MELTITRVIDINIEEILDSIEENYSYTDIVDEVTDYIGALEDEDYYIIGDEEITKIVKEVERRLAEKGR